MSDDLNRQIFKEEAYDLLRELEGALLELEEAPDDSDLINQIFRALHTIKGSGSMFGFEEIAEFTHEVETVFDKVRNGEVDASPVLCSLALQARDQIRAMLDSEDDEVVDSEKREAILQGLREFVAETLGGGEDAGEAVEATPAVEEESAEESEEPGEVDGNAFAIRLTPKGDAEIDVSAVESFFEELDRIGELTVRSRHGDTGAGWELGLVTDAAKDGVEDVFFFLDADVDVVVSEESQSTGAEQAVESPEPAVEAPEPESVAEETVSEAPPVFSGTFTEDEAADGEGVPKIGEILVESGELAEEDVAEALEEQKGAGEKKPLGQILAQKGKVAPDKITKAVKQQAEAKERDGQRKKQDAPYLHSGRRRQAGLSRGPGGRVGHCPGPDYPGGIRTERSGHDPVGRGTRKAQ